MKIRLSKKIWNGAINKKSHYWLDKFVKADKLDSRITQYSRKLIKWESNNLKNRLKSLFVLLLFKLKKLEEM